MFPTHRMSVSHECALSFEQEFSQLAGARHLYSAVHPTMPVAIPVAICSAISIIAADSGSLCPSRTVGGQGLSRVVASVCDGSQSPRSYLGCVASSSVRGWSARVRGLFPCVLLGEGTTLRRKGGRRWVDTHWIRPVAKEKTLTPRSLDGSMWQSRS